MPEPYLLEALGLFGGVEADSLNCWKHWKRYDAMEPLELMTILHTQLPLVPTKNKSLASSSRKRINPNCLLSATIKNTAYLRSWSMATSVQRVTLPTNSLGDRFERFKRDKMIQRVAKKTLEVYDNAWKFFGPGLSHSASS